jgi:hypothetical protein
MLEAMAQGQWVLLAFNLTALGTGVFLGWAAMKFKAQSANEALRASRVTLQANAQEPR